MELLQSMRLFARLAELGSFTKAAESLDIGRPQVTRYIQELETSLGVRLFQRTTRKVALTAEGERFYERLNASRVARAAGSKRAHNPTNASRNVGIPLSQKLQLR